MRLPIIAAEVTEETLRQPLHVR